MSDKSSGPLPSNLMGWSPSSGGGCAPPELPCLVRGWLRPPHPPDKLPIQASVGGLARYRFASPPGSEEPLETRLSIRLKAEGCTGIGGI